MKPSKKPYALYRTDDDALFLLFDTGEMEHVCALLACGERIQNAMLQLIAAPLRELIRRIYESGRGDSASELDAVNRFLSCTEITASILTLSEGQELESGEAKKLSDNLQRAWEGFIAHAAAPRMYHDLPRALVKQAKTSEKQSKRAKGAISETTPVIYKLAAMKDELGDYLRISELWDMFSGELDLLDLHPEEVKPSSPKERKYVFDGGQFKFVSFKSAIAKARK